MWLCATVGRVDRKVWADDHHRGDGGHRQGLSVVQSSPQTLVAFNHCSSYRYTLSSNKQATVLVRIHPLFLAITLNHFPVSAELSIFAESMKAKPMKINRPLATQIR